MHKISPVETFKTGWQLIHDPDNAGRDEKWFLGIPKEGAVSAEVPSYVHMYLPDCREIAWYERRFCTALRPDANHKVYLNFEMADFYCEAYLNGKLLGVHCGMEDPFSFDATDVLEPDGENLLCIRISRPNNNTVDGYTFDEIPHKNQRPDILLPGHNYNGYGLNGTVTLLLLPKLRITDLYLYANTETSCIDVQCTLMNDYSEAVDAKLSMLAGDKRTGVVEAEVFSTFTANPGETVVNRSIPLTEVRTWDLDDPNLYIVNAELCCADTSHILNKHCGFRTFVVGQDGWFYLNGKRIFLRCSHTGNCFPESVQHISRDKALLRKDFTMAKAAGLNMVRFISCVALPEQLDICDEIGLMIYEEPTSSWCQHGGTRTKELYQHDLLTMVKRDRSHPCVTIWGLLNETRSEEIPKDEVCYIARESLPEVHELDETRVVLYNSGRFDGDPWIGSVCNPYSHKWECLWGDENEKLHEHFPRDPEKHPVSYYPKVGDIHMYPRLPYSKEDINLIRTGGTDAKRPVFISESGAASLFNVLWLQRKFEENGASPEMPDVRMINLMARLFLEDLYAYGMEDEYAFPSDIMQQSYRYHAHQRRVYFDMLRSNPYLCGLSLTGLLDHSICGEGLWTLMREWKPGIADVLQDGFAPLRWCLLMSDTHVYSGRPFTIEGVLANEDVLKIRKYPIRIRIFGKEGSVWDESIELSVTAENQQVMAVPVFKKEITLNVTEGEYTLRAEILEGAAAFGGSKTFYVSEDDKTKATLSEIVGIGLDETAKAFLKRKGVKVLQPENVTAPSVVLVGDLADSEKEEAWKTICCLLDIGCRVLSASRYTMIKDNDWTYYLPLEHKPQHVPSKRESLDSLYHAEYMFRRNHPYFKQLKTGLADLDYYMSLIYGAFLRDDESSRADDVPVAGFYTGWAGSPTGYIGGLNIASYHVGKGSLILSTFRLLENLEINPAADRLLLNILNEEYRNCR